MLIKKIVLGVCMILIAGLAYAVIIKGNLGPGRIKVTPVVTGESTFLPVIVMNDNFNSDFDIFIVNASDEVVCSSTSTFRQIEKVECGLPPNANFDILVENFSGPGSPYRLYIGDEIPVLKPAKPSRLSQKLGTDELLLQDLPTKVRDQIKKISARK